MSPFFRVLTPLRKKLNYNNKSHRLKLKCFILEAHLNANCFAVGENWLQRSEIDVQIVFGLGLNNSEFVRYGEIVAKIFQAGQVPRNWQHGGVLQTQCLRVFPEIQP